MLFTPEQRNPPKIRQSYDAFPVFILRGYKNTTPFWSMSLCFFVTFLNLDSHSITLTQILVCVVTVTHPAGALLGCDLQTKKWQKLKLQRKTSANLIIHGVRAPPLDSNSTLSVPLSEKPRDDSVRFRFCVYEAGSGLICKRWHTNKDAVI